MSSFNTSPQISCSLHERPCQLISIPTISTTIPLGWMGLPNKKGAGATAGVAGRTGGDFFSTSAHATALLAVTGEEEQARALQWALQPAERAQSR
jgi:hypothetical protein